MKNHKLSSLKYWLLSRLLKTKSEQGYVLVIAMGLLFGLAGLMLVYAKSSRLEGVSSTATVDNTSGFYAAEAALNERTNEITEIYLATSFPTGQEPANAAACFDNDPTNNGTGDYKCKTFSYSGGDAESSKFSATTYVVPRDDGRPVVGNVPPGENHAGLNMIEYGHSVYALTFKDTDVQLAQQSGNGQGKGAIAIIQMDIKNRLIPLFQFAAFYKDDLEIFPGPPMFLNGPIHTNGDLYIGGALKEVRGEVTVAGKNIYKAKKVATPVNPNDYKTQVQDVFKIPSLKVGIEPLGLPEPDFLTTGGEYYQKADIRIKYKPAPTASTGNMNYLKNYIPFELTSIDRSTGTTKTLTDAQLMSLLQPVMVGGDIAAIDKYSGKSPKGNDIPNPFYACQPEAISAFPSITTPSGTGITTFNTWWNGLTYQQKNIFRKVTQQYIQEQIHSLNAPLLYSLLYIPIVDVKVNNHNGKIKTPVGAYATNLYGNFAQNPSSLGNNNDLKQAFPDNTERKKALDFIEKMSANQIASLPEYNTSNQEIPNTKRCFVAAPIIDIGRDQGSHLSPFRFYNNREARDMRLLQINLQSLAIWNRDGEYLDSGNVLKKTAGQNLIYVPAPPYSSAPDGSFQRLGLAAKDTTEDGIVIHATIDKNTYTYPPGKSPYGFALVKGQQLFGLGTTGNNTDPTGVTFATDQAIYVQGNYNVRREDYHTDAPLSMTSPTTSSVTRRHNYQPASILADTFQPLSNACLTDDGTISRLPGVNCDTKKDVNGIYQGKTTPTHTEFNAGVVASIDISTGSTALTYNGGLENYPRFLENWNMVEWRYQGSFVSLSTPRESSGKWGNNDVYSPPLRPWDYDSAFNDAKNLPPLTPRFSTMKQESFIRRFEQ